MDILFICIQSLTFFPADSKTVTNSWNTAAERQLNFLILSCSLLGVCLLVCFVLFYFYFFLFLWLFYFSTLAVIDCLIEVQSFAIPEPRVFLSQMWLKTSTFRLVLRERRTVCFAAALSVTVACWRATMLLHRHHTTSPPEQSDDHRRPHLSVSSAVMGFSLSFLSFSEDAKSRSLSVVFI